MTQLEMKDFLFFLGGSLIGLILGMAGNISVTSGFKLLDDLYTKNEPFERNPTSCQNANSCVANLFLKINPTSLYAILFISSTFVLIFLGLFMIHIFYLIANSN